VAIIYVAGDVKGCSEAGEHYTQYEKAGEVYLV
jgi:hypothetical protein